VFLMWVMALSGAAHAVYPFIGFRLIDKKAF
jgi:hypothetical protein